DSFVYNLARYVRELGEETVVRRHDATSYEEIEQFRPSHIIISPGPCSPGEAGISTDVVRRFGSTTPILGVCLGHQCIGAAYGAAARTDWLPDRADGARAPPPPPPPAPLLPERAPGIAPPPPPPAELVR